MNNWQEWIVGLLLLLCAVRIGMSVYSFFVVLRKIAILVKIAQVAVN